MVFPICHSVNKFDWEYYCFRNIFLVFVIKKAKSKNLKKDKKIKRTLIASPKTTTKRPGWNHETAIGWRSKNSNLPRPVPNLACS